MPKLLLNQDYVKISKCPEGKKKLDIFDSACKGLMLEIRETGGKTWYLRYTNHRGKTRQLKLCDAHDLPLSQARTLAEKHRGSIAMGRDPAEEKLIARQAPTMREFFTDHYLPFIKTYKKSWGTDRSLFENHILPAFKCRYLNEITKQEVIAFITKYKETHAPASCNRLLILLRYMFNLAIKWESPGLEKNPTSGIPLLEENNKRERFLRKEEVETIYKAIMTSDNRMLRYIVPVLIMTGARKRELLNARWEDFDLERRIWCIPVSKSGKRRHVPISDGVVSIIGLINETRICPWPFGNPKTRKPFISIFYSWDTARKKAGLNDVRIHDLRHSFASFLINSGRSLYEVQKILGHTQLKTTERYAHLSNESLLSAANEASKVASMLEMHNLPLMTTQLSLF